MTNVKGSGPQKSSITGKFVSSHYAKTHPNTTYRVGGSKKSK